MSVFSVIWGDVMLPFLHQQSLLPKVKQDYVLKKKEEKFRGRNDR